MQMSEEDAFSVGWLIGWLVVGSPRNSGCPMSLVMHPLARISRAHRQVGKPGAQVEVDRLHHDSLFLWNRGRRRFVCMGYLGLYIVVLMARVWEGVGLLELHDPLANVGRQLAVPHALTSGTAPQ